MQQHHGGIVTCYLLVTVDTEVLSPRAKHGSSYTQDSAPGVLLRHAASTSRDANPELQEGGKQAGYIN